MKDGAYTNFEKTVQRLSGFFYDVKHIATYAPYCDAFVVDQPMAELVRKKTVAVSERYGVHIFSLNNWDDLMIWLDRLARNVGRTQAGARPGISQADGAAWLVSAFLFPPPKLAHHTALPLARSKTSRESFCI